MTGSPDSLETARVLEAPTLEDAAKWTLKESNHYNGGKEWFGYLMRCVEQPRLARFDKYIRATKSVVNTWRVDGEDCKSLQDAIDELAYPARLTADEALVLAQIGREPADHRKTISYEMRALLHDKGVIAYGPPGRCYRTLSDEALLGALGSIESNASGNPQWEYVSAKVGEARAALRAARDAALSENPLPKGAV